VFLADYVIIALCQWEKMKAAGRVPAKMLVRRIELTSASEKKRKRDQKEEKTARQYEYVAINTVAESLVRHLRSTYGVKAGCKGHEIRLYAYCVALLSSDFTAGIPKVGCVTFFKNMKLIWGPLQDAYDPVTQHFNVRKVADQVVAPLLAIVNKKHAGAASGKSITKLLQTIKLSPHLSDTARNAIPSVADIACLVRGSNWTLQYWFSAETVPACDEKYGFVMRPNGEVERDKNASLD
jgi:hypothetical protein